MRRLHTQKLASCALGAISIIWCAALIRMGGTGHAATPADSRATPGRAKRLADFIVRRQPKARRYAILLAERILFEAHRRSIRPEHLAAIGWIESDYRRGWRGTKGELGIWQLGAWGGDHRMPQGWDEIRGQYGYWPIVKLHGNQTWAQLRKHSREQIVDDVRAGTYLVALELWSVKRTCYRMRNLRHWAGGVHWRASNWYLHRGPDVYAHYQSGNRPPQAKYLRKLRGRSRVLRRILEGKP